MNSTQTRGAVVLVVALALLTVVGVAAFGVGPLSDDSAADSTAVDHRNGAAADDRPDDPSTNETIGYVEGYWYDDSLPADDRDDAALEEGELEPVVYRSMARVERLRNTTFDEEVAVDVVSRAEFRANNEDLFVNVTAEQRLQANVNYEALFAVDRNTDAIDESQSLYGDAVGGYYEPTEDRIVIVSNTPDTPELNEVVLGHELVHALQDQHYNLTSYERPTIDQDNAKNGLIEGDASWIESQYDRNCGSEWDCVLPDDSGNAGSSGDGALEPNWGLYLTIYLPYDEGPEYVDYLYEQGGWDRLNGAYDDPPTTSSAVIHPGSEREPADVDVPDRSNDDWTQYEVDGRPATETVGEAGMVAMFAGGAFESGEPSVIDRNALLASGDPGYEYDQPQTDGWAGDTLVTYVNESRNVDANATMAAVDHAGYVWRTEWLSSAESEEFADAYLELLEGYGAEPVDDRRNTYAIDDTDFPGAYYVDRDGETVTIVRAPSVDDLDALEAGAAPSGEDTLAFGSDGGSGSTTESASAGADANRDRDGGALAALGRFGAPLALLGLAAGLVLTVALAIASLRGRSAARVHSRLEASSGDRRSTGDRRDFAAPLE
ncbi:Hvo_1808 family surface protein [Halopiger thermotolerans]